MKVRSGSAIGTVVWAIAGVVALGAGGYSYMTGNTLCSLVSSCDSGAQVSVVASTDGESCCALKSAAAQATVAAVSSCSIEADEATEVVAVNAAATENAADCDGCPFAQAAAAQVTNAALVEDAPSECCASKAAQATEVVAAAPSECSLAKAECASKAAQATNVVAAAPSECSVAKTECASKAAQATEVIAAAPSECSANKTCSTATVAQTQAFPVANASWTLASAGFPMAMPVFLYECGAVAADCSVASICSTKQVIATSACSGRSSCGAQATNVVAVATDADCCKGDIANCCRAGKAVEAVAIETTKKCGPDCQLACCISE